MNKIAAFIPMQRILEPYLRPKKMPTPQPGPAPLNIIAKKADEKTVIGPDGQHYHANPSESHLGNHIDLFI